MRRGRTGGRQSKAGARRWLGLGLALAGFLVSASIASASPLIPPGFNLQASNGFKVFGIIFDGTPREEHDELLLFVVGKDSAVGYFSPVAKIDETSVLATLGSVGSVNLQFVATGRPHSVRTPCGTPRAVTVESGYYEGAVDLRGEEGYMHARAVRVAGDTRTTLGLICPGSTDVEGFGGFAPGARFSLHRRMGDMTVDFSARKNSPTSPSRFEASIQERRGRLGISRELSSTGPASSFDFDMGRRTVIPPPRRLARIDPPAPFSGRLAFSLGPRIPSRLAGSLTVDFPGRSDVRVVGPGAKANLVRYVDNPSHHFKLPRLSPWLSTKP